MCIYAYIVCRLIDPNKLHDARSILYVDGGVSEPKGQHVAFVEGFVTHVQGFKPLRIEDLSVGGMGGRVSCAVQGADPSQAGAHLLQEDVLEVVPLQHQEVQQRLRGEAGGLDHAAEDRHYNDSRGD